MSVWQIAEYSMVVSVVALLILGMKRLFHDKLDARWHYFIWLVLGVRMVVPFSLNWLKSTLSLFEAIPVHYWVKVWRLKAERAGILRFVDVIDQFLHWTWDFQNGLESLIIAVLSVYTLYILLGEIGLRVEKEQPEQAGKLYFIRKALTIFYVLGYLFSEYQNRTLAWILPLVMIVVLVSLMWVLFKIEPV